MGIMRRRSIESTLVSPRLRYCTDTACAVGWTNSAPRTRRAEVRASGYLINLSREDL